MAEPRRDGKSAKKGARESRGKAARSSGPRGRPARRETFAALAVDIGASNGRAVFGELSADGRLTMKEIRRFPNGMVSVDGAQRWDFQRLLGEVVAALEDCARAGLRPRSVGIDTWGVDYALIGTDGKLVDMPFAYRDRRCPPAMERFFREAMRPEEIYAITGIQFMPFNTLYQLAADVFAGGERLARASRILMMPDAFAWALSGEAVAEYTIASTSQMLDARLRDWSPAIVDKLGIRRELLPPIVAPGTRIGAKQVASGLSVDVVVPAGHDTAAAVAAVPASPGQPWAYVSSGTWSLVGVETREPVLTESARLAGVTNEGGVEGTYRLLSNVMGLWLLQECMRMWEKRSSAPDIAKVCEEAASAPPDGPLVDPDDRAFLAPEDMLQAIAEFCRRTGQRPPEGVGPTARCIFESLALKTRAVLERISGLTGVRPEVLHMVGGGTRNSLLCQSTADATGLPVIAGPAEATAIGNLLVQAMAAGRLSGLAELRKVVRESERPARYEPSGDERWRRRWEVFQGLLPRS